MGGFCGMIHMESHKWCCSNPTCYKTMQTQEVSWIFDGKDWHGFCADHRNDISPFKYYDLKCSELKTMAQNRGLTALARKGKNRASGRAQRG